MGLASMVYKFLIKSLQAVVLICMHIMSVLWIWLLKNELKNYTNQLLENLEKEQFIQDLKTILGVLI